MPFKPSIFCAIQASPNRDLSSAFKSHSACLAPYHNVLAPSMSVAEEHCQRKPIVVSKILRLKMESMNQVSHILRAAYEHS